jgi:hypothetical protein
MRTLFDRVLYLFIRSVKVKLILTIRVSLRVATPIRQSVGTHLVDSLRCLSRVVVVVVAGLKFGKIMISKNVWES